MKRLKSLTIALVFGLSFGLCATACGPTFRLPLMDESGNESGTEIGTDIASNRAPAANPAGPDTSAGPVQAFAVDQATNVRKLVNGVLEFVVELPPGAKISVPVSYQITQPDVRDANGSIERSSTGFVGSVQIISTPSGAGQLSAAQIAVFNKLDSQLGLFVSASIVGTNGTVGDTFKSVTPAAPAKGFASLFAANGKPKFSFTADVMKRFGSRINQGLVPDSLEALKYQKIFGQLQMAADRKAATSKSFLLIDKALAKKSSLAFEATGAISPLGAWSIAVGQTAVRHGFENVPCAEFMSEMVREAYQRAGYPVTKDFNSGRHNPLIWSTTASVQGFSAALFAAGWVAWEPSKYRPPTGAIMMHGAALSPGHTFMAAGDDGQIVIDNGSPQGRDLRVMAAATLKMMYEDGVFFLPPGISPKPW